MSESAQPTTSDFEPLYEFTSVIDRIPLDTMFPKEQPLEIEIGAGDGSFIDQWHQLHPERNYLALERLLGRLTKIRKKALRSGLCNLICIRAEASYFTDYLLPAQWARAFHIYFPDPWPKKRHQKNRLIQPGYAAAVWRALEPGGAVYLRTDDVPYFTHMKEVFASVAGLFAETETPAELAAVTTDFERFFNAKGIPTNYAAYRRIG